MRAWQSLVQVCERWRETICASKHYLDLFLYHSNGRRVEETIASCPWPAIPFFLDFCVAREDEEDADNLRATLAQRDRIRRVQILMTITEANWFAKLMEEEFPQLTHLDLIGAPKYNVPYISFDRFLGGSAPSLQHLCIDDFDYGGLPSLISSAPNLVSLQIKNIRPACYMSPEAMVGALAGLTKLRDLCIAFSSWIPSTYQFHDGNELQSSRSLTRIVFPTLTKLQFEGDRRYLEDLINLIDAPRLEDLHVQYPNLYVYEGLRPGNLPQFITRAETLKHSQFRRAEVTLNHHRGCTYVLLDLPRGERQQHCLSYLILDHWQNLLISFADTSSHMINWLGQLAIMLSDVQYLSIESKLGQERDKWRGGENADWLLLLRSFSAVEVLDVSGESVKHIASALGRIPEEMVAQVLPSLQLLLLDKKGEYMPMDQFLLLRRLSGRPVVVVESREEFMEKHNPHQLGLSESPRKNCIGSYELRRRGQ